MYVCIYIQGSKAAMNILREADLVLAIGTRLGPFGTLPQYGIDYWPRRDEDCYVIQVRMNIQRIRIPTVH